ncbi:hypothetical protein, partial [Nocardia sp. NRRL S-836]|uniref:hypothetical protein n=1 Tax=Nocardia sp. NRRL S-836 TaxID=1519492 RepID=UPI0006C44353
MLGLGLRLGLRLVGAAFLVGARLLVRARGLRAGLFPAGLVALGLFLRLAIPGELALVLERGFLARLGLRAVGLGLLRWGRCLRGKFEPRLVLCVLPRLFGRSLGAVLAGFWARGFFAGLVGLQLAGTRQLLGVVRLRLVAGVLDSRRFVGAGRAVLGCAGVGLGWDRQLGGGLLLLRRGLGRGGGLFRG